MQDRRLIQVFLPKTATPGVSIYEVSSDPDGVLYCNCAGYVDKGTCKHVRLVNSRIKENKGTYPLEMIAKSSKEEAEEARASAESFRNYIIKFGKIEVY